HGVEVLLGLASEDLHHGAVVDRHLTARLSILPARSHPRPGRRACGRDGPPAEDLGLQPPPVPAEFEDAVEERLRGRWPVPQRLAGVLGAAGHLKMIHAADAPHAIAEA